MKKFSTLVLGLVIAAIPMMAQEMTVVANQGNQASGGFGNGAAVVAPTNTTFAQGSFNQGSSVIVTQSFGYGSLYAETNNCSTLSENNFSSWNVSKFTTSGNVSTSLNSNGSGNTGPVTVVLEANGSLNTASQASLTGNNVFGFGNTSTFGSFSIAPTYFNNFVLGSGSTCGSGTSTVTFTNTGVNVNACSGATSQVCPVVVK